MQFFSCVVKNSNSNLFYATEWCVEPDDSDHPYEVLRDRVWCRLVRVYPIGQSHGNAAGLIAQGLPRPDAELLARGLKSVPFIDVVPVLHHQPMIGFCLSFQKQSLYGGDSVHEHNMRNVAS